MTNTDPQATYGCICPGEQLIDGVPCRSTARPVPSTVPVLAILRRRGWVTLRLGR
jgi:hypothetical protein